MHDILFDIGQVIDDLLNPAMFTFVGTLLTSGWMLLKRIRKIMNKTTDEQFDRVHQQLEHQQQLNNDLIKAVNDNIDAKIAPLTAQVNESTKEILRLNLLDGMASGRLSVSEVSFFYDKYKALGGNSFVTQKVHEYIEKKEKD